MPMVGFAWNVSLDDQTAVRAATVADHFHEGSEADLCGRWEIHRVER